MKINRRRCSRAVRISQRQVNLSFFGGYADVVAGVLRLLIWAVKASIYGA